MRLLTIIGPLLGLGCLAALLPVRPIKAYTIGSFHKLSPEGADFRVFNNFSDVSANDNQVPDPNFPGQQGAVMAIWKASVEWGSTLHGNGAGDPHQPNGLGSGGANFDLSFQGLAPSATPVGGNVHSEISGSAAGTFAFTELNSNGQWHIRYYSAWNWDDGPGTQVSGVDLQSVATHEMGHALGLGHSTVPGATMAAAYSQGATSARSIEDDDIAGVQALYGAVGANKTRITGLSWVGAQLKISGENFGGLSTRAWFTNPDGSGQPLEQIGNIQNNGNAMFVNLPQGVVPGDVLVNANGLNSFLALSNAWPYDPTQQLPCYVTGYGGSQGGANKLLLHSTSTPTLGKTITVGIINAQVGSVAVVLFSLSKGSQPFMGGTQLIDFNQIVHTKLLSITGSPMPVKLDIPTQPGLAGLHVFGQAAALDLTQPGGLAFSNGLELVLCAP